jgi:uncharacterized protein (TIGR02453 family)
MAKPSTTSARASKRASAAKAAAPSRKASKPAPSEPAAAKPARRGTATAKPNRASPSATEEAAFRGYPRDAMQFWHELAAEMNRDWFSANKERYQTQWVDPTTALLTEVARRLAPVYKPLTLAPPKVMRIHRDVRFSKDKTPYKLHIGAVLSLAGAAMAEGGAAALYLHLGVDEEFVGVGTYQFDPQTLARWRKVVAGSPGAALATLIGELRAAGYKVGGHDDYKRVPKGFPEDHPRAELLKMKGLTAAMSEIPRGLLHQPGLVDWAAEHSAALAPLVKWLTRHLS